MTNEVNQLTILLIAFVSVGGLFFELNNNTVLKRKLYPAWSILFGASVIGWLVKYTEGWQTYAVGLTPIAIAIAWSIWATKFCSTCGKTNFSGTSLKPPVDCKRCGASLKENKIS